MKWSGLVDVVDKVDEVDDEDEIDGAPCPQGPQRPLRPRVHDSEGASPRRIDRPSYISAAGRLKKKPTLYTEMSIITILFFRRRDAGERNNMTNHVFPGKKHVLFGKNPRFGMIENTSCSVSKTRLLW